MFRITNTGDYWDRDIAFLCSDVKVKVSDSNHQYLLEEYLEEWGIGDNIDVEDINYCKDLELKHNLVALDLFSDVDENCYLLVQSPSYFENLNFDILEQLLCKYSDESYKLGFFIDYYDKIALTDSREEFLSALKLLKRRGLKDTKEIECFLDAKFSISKEDNCSISRGISL